ncbi:MAG: hypothetical protein HZB33_03825 [Nitrospirae bacterium]|nr:hypothetical protein [Nitrospirota bacterium]
MGKVVSYKNDERHCFCQIKFDIMDRVLVSVAGVPVPGIRVIKLLFGLVPAGTIWEIEAPEGEKRCNDWLVAAVTGGKDAGLTHPLDAVIHKLLPCRSSVEAVLALKDAGAEAVRKS